MPMERENHEELLNELNNAELTHERRTEILQLLRTDYVSVHSEFEQVTASIAKLKANNDDLVIANSKMFRELGYKADDPSKKEHEEKEFSETVTLEELEKQH